MGDPLDPKSMDAQSAVRRYSVSYQPWLEFSKRPEDIVLHEMKSDTPPLLPAVGDSVHIEGCGRRSAFKVLTRHFSYIGDWCIVNIVVDEISDEEMGRRLKE